MADPIVFGRDHIPRYQVNFGTGLICDGCGIPAHKGRWWGGVDGRPYCGPCCDKEERSRT